MKKSLVLFLAAFLITTPIFAQSEEDDITWKEQGKKALQETGKFLKKAGETIKEEVGNASEIKCFGTWKYSTKNVTTTFICREDGTMEITKKIGSDTDYWRGTYSATFKVLSFKVTEAGRKGLIFDTKSENPEQNWKITYFLQEDENTIKIISSDIPRDIDGTDFGKGIIFTRK